MIAGFQRSHGGGNRRTNRSGKHRCRVLKKRTHERCIYRWRHRIGIAMVIGQLHQVRAHPFFGRTVLPNAGEAFLSEHR
jgi:hypothetical protein